MSYTALIDDLRYGGMERGAEIADLIESQAREIDELKATNDTRLQLLNDALVESDELRAALVSAIDALSDFDYDKRLAALTLCKEVIK
jgi:DNA repair ATPase RecN